MCCSYINYHLKSAVSKDKWDKKEDTDYVHKNTYYGILKGTSWAKMMKFEDFGFTYSNQYSTWSCGRGETDIWVILFHGLLDGLYYAVL